MPHESPLEVTSNAPRLEVVGRETTDALRIPTEDELLSEAARIGGQLRDFIVLAKRLPRTPGLEPHQDQTRALAQAQAHLQIGFMWIKRAISPTKEF